MFFNCVIYLPEVCLSPAKERKPIHKTTWHFGGRMESSCQRNAHKNSLIYVPRSYLPSGASAIGFIFNDEGGGAPMRWRKAHMEQCTEGQYRVIGLLAGLMGTTKAGAVKYLLLSRQDPINRDA